MKASELADWIYQRTTKYNRVMRIAVGERMERLASDLLDALLTAKYTTGPHAKVELLRRANLCLELLRLQVRLAVGLQLIGRPGHAEAGQLIYDVGTQIGGWLRHTTGTRMPTPANP